MRSDITHFSEVITSSFNCADALDEHFIRTGIPLQPAELQYKLKSTICRLMQVFTDGPTFQHSPAVTASPHKNSIHCLNRTKLIKQSTHCTIKLHINTRKVVFYLTDATRTHKIHNLHLNTSNSTDRKSLTLN